MIRPFFKLALILSVIAPSLAHAMFVANYASWKKGPPEVQQAYLVGVIDDWAGTSTPGEPPWMKAQRTGVIKCIRERGISATMLVDLVNTHYKNYTADWRVPPAIVVKDVLMATCLADVNIEREKAGFSPWERKNAQISRDN
ncbi:hypothetical protein [Pararhizobium sp. DWP3-4]|uniref:hypothetical protein n=1 Tax=Pararhizobium sp. DWP3-4 TaxID=2804565 RepID=UPI003CEB4A2C